VRGRVGIATRIGATLLPRLAHIGKEMSVAHRAIISKTNKGKKHSDEHVKKRIASRLVTLMARKQLKKEV
jgi:hypothetical protein